MTKADRYLGHEICDILSEGYKDVNPRPKYADGTPAHTISINQVMRKYDLSKGEFGKQLSEKSLQSIRNPRMLFLKWKKWEYHGGHLGTLEMVQSVKDTELLLKDITL